MQQLLKHAKCHGYTMQELSNGDVQVINPAGLPIARTVSFREAVKIIEADVHEQQLAVVRRVAHNITEREHMERVAATAANLYSWDGTEDPFHGTCND